MRLRLDISYDGQDFHGWAGQPGLRTVQGELETWIQRVLRLSEAPALVCAGRTDAGVHARGQVAHLDLPDDSQADQVAAELHRRLRLALPEDVAVNAVRPAPDGFDARFSAVWRRYVYRLTDDVVDPLSRRTIARVRDRVDVEELQRAAQLLLGLQNFAAFCRHREGATTIRQLLALQAVRAPSGPVEITVRADAFCHSMVRSLVGALVAVGTGQRDTDWLVELLRRRVRAGEINVMPAHGLVLEEVGYPADDQLAQRAAQARSTRTMEA
ncbi:MAG: tRNA pseudouridine(38-40) synthase TruA [Micropruina sp.]